MIQEIINKLKYSVNKKILASKYGLGESKIDIDNNTIYLYTGAKYRSMISIGDIVDIVYNIDEAGYYFRVKATGNKSNQFFFDRKYDIRYRAKNIENFINKIKALHIELTPDFGQYGALYECQFGGIIQYCTMSSKYLLTLTKGKHNTIYLNHGTFDRSVYGIIDLENLNIEKEMNCSPKKILSEKKYDVTHGVYILDKSLTFDRGYCLTAVDLSGCYNTPMVFGDDIFYSFDEEEIKNKIVELFEKYK